MASAPPGFVRDMPAPQRAPAPPPGFVRDTRPEMPSTGTAEEFGERMAQGREFGYAISRTAAHNLLPSLVDKETPEQGAQFDRLMTEIAGTLVGGMAGKALGSAASNSLKYLGRGFKTLPEASQFIASNPVRAAEAARQGVSAGDLLTPAISGTVVAAATDTLDPAASRGGGEFGDAMVSGGTGLATTALVGKKAAEDLLLGNAKWQRVMMRPSAGTASAVLGALLGWGISRGINLTRDVANDAANYVANLFGQEEQR